MNKLCIIMLCLVMLALAACSENLFGSSGGSGGADCDENIDCWILEAEGAFRAGKYSSAYEYYGKIVRIDSTRSVGYVGMAKAGLWMHNVTVFNLVDLFKGQDINMEDHTEIIDFFKGIGPDTLNNYLQGSKKSFKALNELNRRDSITREGKERLSDMKYEMEDFNAGFNMSKTLRFILGLPLVFDVWQNGCIYKDPKDVGSDILKYGCDCYLEEGCPDGKLKGSSLSIDVGSLFTFGDDNTPQINLEEIYEEVVSEDGEVNTELVDDLNNSLIGLSDDLENNLSSVPLPDEVKQNLNDLKDYAMFYTMHDGEDNDGDGCIDEEIMFSSGLSFDADGDGLAGEDSRFVPTMFWVCDNPRTQCIHQPASKRHDDDYFIMTIDPISSDTIDVKYVASQAPGFWSSYYKSLPDNESRRKLKMRIQMREDEDGNEKCYSLAERRLLIGGCWNWSTYDSNDAAYNKGCN